MSLVNVTSVEVRNNPSPMDGAFEFEVVFECLEALENDLEWKLIYVGSADDKTLDQELDCVVMGPIHRGALKFTFDADAPDFTKIPAEDIHGFTIVLLTGSYDDEEFIRIGWYIHNVYEDPELQDDPPDLPDISKMQRMILTEAPRVTRFKISWDRPKLDETLPTSLSAIAECEDGEECPMQAISTNSYADFSGNSNVHGAFQESPMEPSSTSCHGGPSSSGYPQSEMVKRQWNDSSLGLLPTGPNSANSESGNGTHIFRHCPPIPFFNGADQNVNRGNILGHGNVGMSFFGTDSGCGGGMQVNDVEMS